MTLTFANYSSSEDNLDNIIGSNLAREGIELIRNVRDSNWLRVDSNNNIDCGVSGAFCTWDYSLASSEGKYFYIDYNDDFPTVIPASTCVGGLEDCVSAEDVFVLNINSAGFYSHDSDNNLSKYSRGIQLSKICVEETPGSDPQSNEYKVNANLDCGSGDTHIGFEVRVYVLWGTEPQQNVSMSDDLYNWKR